MDVHRAGVRLDDGRWYDDVLVSGRRMTRVLGRDDVPSKLARSSPLRTSLRGPIPDQTLAAGGPPATVQNARSCRTPRLGPAAKVASEFVVSCQD